jgi:riboflavin kinase/FMN adenylyltransferase
MVEARNHNLAPTVLTFDPHPSRVVAPQRAPKLLTTIDERVALMREIGITQVLVLAFHDGGRAPDPGTICRTGSGGCAKGSRGDRRRQFRYGHKQAGDTASLAALGARFGFRTHTLTRSIIGNKRFRRRPFAS